MVTWLHARLSVDLNDTWMPSIIKDNIHTQQMVAMLRAVQLLPRVLPRLHKTPLFFEVSLCLSRACLGKMFVLIYKWRKKWRFSHLLLPLLEKCRLCHARNTRVFLGVFPLFVPSLSG